MPRWRLVLVEDSAFPGYVRIVWNDHVREFSDLAPADRVALMEVVATVERVMLAVLAPDKINLAAFGTMVPHLHWHVIARFADDSHWPDAIWAPARRTEAGPRCTAAGLRVTEFTRQLLDALEAHSD
ncbi:HIT family protein [Derxia lacustris]|uniref:HIT family protein n=1 Tax=Derxia lacustris TaxID=764842 RepID=UPI000A17792B